MLAHIWLKYKRSSVVDAEEGPASRALVEVYQSLHVRAPCSAASSDQKREVLDADAGPVTSHRKFTI